MRTRIAKMFDFDAAHFLPNVAADHKCRRLHGHTYRVELVCEGVIDPFSGMICDYAEISALWKPFDALLDHRLLNDIPGLENPTTEILAAYLLDRLDYKIVTSLKVFESASTFCEVTR